MTEQKKTYILLVLVPFFWAGAFTAGKLAVVDVPPFTVGFLRFALAGLLLIPIMLHWDPHGCKPKPHQWPALFLLGLTGIFCYNALFFTGLQYTTAISGSLIIAANPMATNLICFLFLKEQFSTKQVAGIALSFCGVVFVLTKGSWATITGLSFNLGDLLMLGSMLSWAAYSILGKKVLEGLTPVTSTTYAVLIGSLIFLPFFIYDLGSFSLATIPLASWVAIIYMAVFASVLGFVWWYQGIKKIGAAKAAVFINLVPIFSIIIASFFGERVQLNQLLGAALVITGVYLTAKPAKQTQISSPTDLPRQPGS